MKIDYFAIIGIPGRYFHCPSYNASLSVNACAAMYKAEKGVRLGRHAHCNGCAIGAQHAGEKPIAAPGLFGSLICPRCQRGTTRLVRGVCVSCVNRQYELVRGVNAKGRAPLRLAPLAPMAMPVREDRQIVVAEVGLCASRLEVVLRSLRSRPCVRAFGWRSASAHIIADLAGGLFAPNLINL